MKPIAFVAIGVVAAVAGFAIYRYGIEPRTAPAAQQQMPPAREEVPPPPASEANTGLSQVPATLPDFTLADLDGKPRSILSWPGKSMVVNFWATWCAPCRREIPLLLELQKQHGGEGFQVVGIAVDFRDDVLKYVKEIGINYPVLIGEQDGIEAVNKFGQGSIGFPFTVFTDNQQRVVLFHLGEIHKVELDVLLDAVRRVNAGELTPDAARTVVAKQLATLKIPDA